MVQSIKFYINSFQLRPNHSLDVVPCIRILIVQNFPKSVLILMHVDFRTHVTTGLIWLTKSSIKTPTLVDLKRCSKKLFIFDPCNGILTVRKMQTFFFEKIQLDIRAQFRRKCKFDFFPSRSQSRVLH